MIALCDHIYTTRTRARWSMTYKICTPSPPLPPRACEYVSRVKRLYRRQLSVPLVGNEGVLPDMCEAFSGDEAGLKEASRGHAQASKMVRACMFSELRFSFESRVQ